MIGLIFIAGAIAWLMVVIYLCQRIPSWFGIRSGAKFLRLALFPTLLILPFADELIGRWQFSQLCEQAAVATLDASWKNVREAKRLSEPRQELSGYIIPIYSGGSRYADAETGNVFLEVPHFYTYGGFLLGRLGLGLDTVKSCEIRNVKAIRQEAELQRLVEQAR